MFVQQTPDENTQVGDGRPASACPPMSDVVVMSSGFKGFYKEEGCNELRAICVHMIFAPFNRVEGVWRDANGEFMLSGSYTNDEIHLVIKSNASVFCRSLVGCRKKTDLITGRWSDPSGSSSEHASSGEFLLSNEEAESRFAPSFDGKRLILYNFVEQIAQGAFGPISLVRRVVDGRMLVCKEIHYAHMNDNERRMAITEVNVLHDVEHQNVVKYYDAIVCHQQLKLFLVTEHCSKGNLSNLIQLYKSQDHQMTETFIWRTLEQILLVLQLLQGREEAILHGDLKPANILMDDKLMVKVAGFGLAAVFKNDEVACTKVGTPVCLPPEQISGVGFAVKSEIWALGCIAYEMAALKPPFDASSQHKSEGCIRTGKVEGIPQGYSPCLYDAICWMLQPDPKDRPSVSDLLSFIQRVDVDALQLATGQVTPETVLGIQTFESTGLAGRDAGSQDAVKPAQAVLQHLENGLPHAVRESVRQLEEAVGRRDEALRDLEARQTKEELENERRSLEALTRCEEALTRCSQDLAECHAKINAVSRREEVVKLREIFVKQREEAVQRREEDVQRREGEVQRRQQSAKEFEAAACGNRGRIVRKELEGMRGRMARQWEEMVCSHQEDTVFSPVTKENKTPLEGMRGRMARRWEEKTCSRQEDTVYSPALQENYSKHNVLVRSARAKMDHHQQGAFEGSGNDPGRSSCCDNKGAQIDKSPRPHPNSSLNASQVGHGSVNACASSKVVDGLQTRSPPRVTQRHFSSSPANTRTPPQVSGLQMSDSPLSTLDSILGLQDCSPKMYR